VPQETRRRWKTIDTAKLAVGTIIYIECMEAGRMDTTLYELVVTHEGHHIVTVNTSHPKIDPGSYCELRSEITENHTLLMKFQKSVHSTGDVMHARVKGKGWYYDVF
jgi:hypothetical protein